MAKNKTVVITGGSTGIGKYLGLFFSQEEYDKWLNEAKQKFAKEELGFNSKKVVKRILKGEIK